MGQGKESDPTDTWADCRLTVGRRVGHRLPLNVQDASVVCRWYVGSVLVVRWWCVGGASLVRRWCVGGVLMTLIEPYLYKAMLNLSFPHLSLTSSLENFQSLNENE